MCRVGARLRVIDAGLPFVADRSADASANASVSAARNVVRARRQPRRPHRLNRARVGCESDCRCAAAAAGGEVA